MAFKENKDGISIDKGAASQAIVSEIIEDISVIPLKAPLNSPSFSGIVAGVSKGMVGLGSADNTSDVDKPISTATQTALSNKANLVGGKLSPAEINNILENVEVDRYFINNYDGDNFANSSDLITWSQSMAPSIRLWTRDPIYADNKFFIGGSNTAAYSTNAISWTEYGFPNAYSFGYYGATAYGHGLFATVLFNMAAYSTNGITWTFSSRPGTGSIIDIKFGGDKFLAVGLQGTATMYSTDGISWNTVSGMQSRQWVRLAYGDGRWVAIAQNSAAVAISTNGIDWSEPGSLPELRNAPRVAYGNGKFIVIGVFANQVPYISTDGISWQANTPLTQAFPPGASSLRSISYQNERFIAFANNYDTQQTYVATSTDGTVWENVSLLSFFFYGPSQVAYARLNVPTPRAIASQSYVDTTIESLIDTAPEALNTLNELSAALNDDENFATTITTALSNKSGLTVVEPSANTNTAISVGYVGLPQVILNSGNLTLSKAHAGEHIYVTGASQTITIPDNSSVPFEIGTTIVVINGNVTSSIAITSDTLRLAGGTTTGTRSLAVYGMATLVKVAATTWIASGNGLT